MHQTQLFLCVFLQGLLKNSAMLLCTSNKPSDCLSASPLVPKSPLQKPSDDSHLHFIHLCFYSVSQQIFQKGISPAPCACTAGGDAWQKPCMPRKALLHQHVQQESELGMQKWKKDFCNTKVLIQATWLNRKWRPKSSENIPQILVSVSTGSKIT